MCSVSVRVTRKFDATAIGRTAVSEDPSGSPPSGLHLLSLAIGSHDGTDTDDHEIPEAGTLRCVVKGKAGGVIGEASPIPPP